MTIDAASSMSSSASVLNYNQMQTGSASSTSELTEEEKQYDVDDDGTLSITEKAAYLEAQAKTKSLDSISKSTDSEGGGSSGSSGSSEITDTVNISEDALKLQKEAQQKGNSLPNPSDISKMSDDELKSTLTDMKENNGQPPKEQPTRMSFMVSEYSKFKPNAS